MHAGGPEGSQAAPDPVGVTCLTPLARLTPLAHRSVQHPGGPLNPILQGFLWRFHHEGMIYYYRDFCGGFIMRA